MTPARATRCMIDPLVQQGSKITAGEESGNAGFGEFMALSADGNTAVIGGPHDNNNAGAAWVFTRSGSTWTQQAKLVGDCTSNCANEGTGESGEGEFGLYMAISADGNTVLIGGQSDNNNAGAAWVFTRSGGAWTQQGAKLVGDCTSNCANEGTGESGEGQFGFSVALSEDGNTAVIGAPIDNKNAGAAWVFTRSGGAWTQQGAKLVATAPAAAQARAPARAAKAGSARAWRCLPTATPRWSVACSTAAMSARRGCSRALAKSGPSKAKSSPAAARAAKACSATTWPSRETGTPR